MHGNFLFDTSIILHYSRKSKVYSALEEKYRFSLVHFKPVICVVSLGEIKAIAQYRKWGKVRIEALDVSLKNFVVIDISSPDVVNAYAKISAHATTHGWALHGQKNDIWIAAVAHVTNSMLLTTDKDFREAHGKFINCEIYDNQTGLIVK